MDFPAWYFSSEALICLCAAAVLYSIYLRGDPGGQRDPTWIWLGYAVLTWSVVGFIGWIYAQSSWFVVTRIIFSTLNSAFLLLTIGYFDYGDYGITGVIGARLKRFAERPAWRKTVILLSLLVAVVVIGFSLAAQSSPLVQSLPDIILSVLTLVVLGVALYESFGGRGFGMLKYLSIFVIGLTVLAQVPETGIIASDFIWPLLLISKTMLIMLFLALATSSVTQQGEFPLEGLELTGEMVDERFLVVRVWMRGESKAREVRVRDTYYNVLLELAQSRKDNPNGYFNLQKAGYYPEYLKRLAVSLKIERPQLLDNNRSGGYRLRIEPEKVTIIPVPQLQD